MSLKSCISSSCISSPPGFRNRPLFFNALKWSDIFCNAIFLDNISSLNFCCASVSCHPPFLIFSLVALLKSGSSGGIPNLSLNLSPIFSVCVFISFVICSFKFVIPVSFPISSIPCFKIFLPLSVTALIPSRASPTKGSLCNPVLIASFTASAEPFTSEFTGFISSNPSITVFDPISQRTPAIFYYIIYIYILNDA